jgi:hypothetical protein
VDVQPQHRHDVSRRRVRRHHAESRRGLESGPQLGVQRCGQRIVAQEPPARFGEVHLDRRVHQAARLTRRAVRTHEAASCGIADDLGVPLHAALTARYVAAWRGAEDGPAQSTVTITAPMNLRGRRRAALRSRAVTLLADLEAFVIDHGPCGELEAGVEGGATRRLNQCRSMACPDYACFPLTSTWAGRKQTWHPRRAMWK